MMDESTVNEQVVKAARARTSAPRMDTVDTPEVVLKKLQEIRTCLDEVETISISLAAAKSNSRSKLLVNQAEYADKWDKALMDSCRRHLSDYSSAKEKEAEANTDTIEFRAAFKTAELQHQKLEDAVQIVRICKDALNSLRQDLLTHYRSFTLEDSISR